VSGLVEFVAMAKTEYEENMPVLYIGHCYRYLHRSGEWSALKYGQQKYYYRNVEICCEIIGINKYAGVNKDSVLLGCETLTGESDPDVSRQRTGVIFKGHQENGILSWTAAKT
jgi:hypothetical protein